MNPETFEVVARRLLLDVLNECSAAYWLRRAEDFDRVGTETCDEIAVACRNKAEFIRLYGDTWPSVAADDVPTIARAA